ncbi:protein disulfide-isomerase [Desulfuromonas versatilis]|uniref:Protein disulfide-isomerase n=1 Tax=Desulfuromonas versatilis TaxID=2802975 RepID=A0ABN6DZ56_9BACT|nr:DsbC family protein [Desulfuromonas versatilis]BCR05353.1 protein disulfide-isomerase [Desulfuromonas versatilis]
MYRKRLALVFAILCLLAQAGTVLAADQPVADPKVAETFRQAFPQVAFQEIYPSPIPGLYEVLAGNKVLYFAPAGKHLLVGDLWDSQGRNLSRERINQVMSKKVADIPLQKALKIGDGPKTVIEITDPDCPYCREASRFFSTRKDVTRYVFFFPLSIHPEAEAKARYILSSPEPSKAYEEVMTGQFDNKPLPEFKDNHQLETHHQITEWLGIQGTPNFWINGVFISGANFQTIEELLK